MRSDSTVRARGDFVALQPASSKTRTTGVRRRGMLRVEAPVSGTVKGGARSPERHLVSARRRTAERARVERRQRPVEIVPPRRRLEERRDLLGVLTLAALAAAEGGIAHATGARVLDPVKHTGLALREVVLQPAQEERIDWPGKMQEYTRRAARARRLCRGQDARNLGIVEPRDHRSDQDR